MRRFFCSVILALCFAAVSLGQVRPQRPELAVLPHVDVTVLVENMAGGGPVLGEWGLSFLVDTYEIIGDGA